LSQEYDVLVVDRMLPRLDGLSIIRLLRKDNNKVPVLVLSAPGILSCITPSISLITL